LPPIPISRPSPLALTVLSLLNVGPLHPYGLQRLIKLWGKDQVVNVGQRANLYKTIKRLHDAGLIEVLQTERDTQFPERTVYGLTDAGREAAQAWLVDMLATPRNEFPAFPAALSFVMLLGPERATTVLEGRAALVRAQLAQMDGELAGVLAGLPRVTRLESEYLHALAAAELQWLEGIVDDLRSGALTWSYEQLSAMAQSYLPE